MTETRQMRRQRERKEQRVEEMAGKRDGTLEERQMYLDGLVTKLQLNQRPTSPRETERIEVIRGGLTVALDRLLTEAKVAEIAMKIKACEEEIDVYKNGIKEE